MALTSRCTYPLTMTHMKQFADPAVMTLYSKSVHRTSTLELKICIIVPPWKKPFFRFRECPPVWALEFLIRVLSVLYIS